jgi:hypothetical protein
MNLKGVCHEHIKITQRFGDGFFAGGLFDLCVGGEEAR